MVVWTYSVLDTLAVVRTYSLLGTLAVVRTYRWLNLLWSAGSVSFSLPGAFDHEDL